MPRIAYRRRDVNGGETFLRFSVPERDAEGGVYGRLHFSYILDTGERVLYHSLPKVPVREA